MTREKLWVLKTTLEKGIDSILHITEYDSLQDLCDDEMDVTQTQCGVQSSSLSNFIDVFKSEHELRIACAKYGRSMCADCIKTYYGDFSK